MTAAGAKIIEGLKDAVAGNFSSVTIEGQRWVRAPEWLPVESAPKDGTRVLIFENSPWKSVEPARWLRAPHDVWIADRGSYIRKATHWMPIPEPPASA